MTRPEAIGSRKIILAGLLVLGALQGIYAINMIGAADLRWRSSCAQWDRDARNALPEQATPAEAAHRDELLRRARQNCDAGRIGVARQTYDALRTAQGQASTTFATAEGPAQ